MGFGQAPTAGERKNLHVNFDLFVPKPWRRGYRAKVASTWRMVLQCVSLTWKKTGGAVASHFSASKTCDSAQLLLRLPIFLSQKHEF